VHCLLTFDCHTGLRLAIKIIVRGNCFLLKKKYIVLSATKKAHIRKLFSNYEQVSAELLFFMEFMQ
jgi:hypothetical protein